MSAQPQIEELTAAECAARTGLTVRALRVYEDHGLIAPRRSAGGWRYYGAAELVRLNTIGLLKTAGLSLSQIHQVTAQGARGPSLGELLEMQVDVWKERKSWAERGEDATEAALQNLRIHDTLSVDELCNLVRSLEMSEQGADAPASGPAQPAIALAPEVVDRLVGHYRISEFALITVSSKDGKLIAKFDGWPPGELIPESETEFTSSLSRARYAFQVDVDRQISGVTVSTNGFDLSAPRIDAAAAEQVKTRLAARIHSNAPVPGSEAALRRLIEALRNGSPDYSELSPAFGATVRKQLSQLQIIARYLGAIQAIEFKGVGRQGWDSYEVRRENGVALWRIAFSDGIITGATATLADGP